MKKIIYLFAILFSIALAPLDVLAAAKLILLQQRVLYNNPDGIKQNWAYIDTLPFNGIVINDNNHSNNLMDGNLHSYDALAASFAPVKGIAWNRMKYNFGRVNIGNPPDFFDDWTNVIESYKNFARAMKDTGIYGIMFDGEDYQNAVWRYPGQIKYPSKTLQEYYDQTRLRGRQVMEAMKSVYPEIRLISLISPAHSYGKTPNIVDCWRQSNYLEGAFFAGLMEASSTPVIDGNEVYAYRTTQEYDASYQFRKYTMGTDPENVPFIPLSLRNANWSSKISISNGLYNKGIGYCDGFRSLNETQLRTLLEYALNKSDEFIWQYWEGENWFIPGGVASPWFNAVKGAWEAAGSGASSPTSTPTPPPTGTLQGDLNKDGIVNSLDWSIMNGKWFTNDVTVDLNSDGIVNSLDFSIVNGNWLKSG